jgi:hypothetical protein
MTKKITRVPGVVKVPVIADKEVVVIHHCTQEASIGEMTGLLKQISAQIYGNGQKGLAITVPALSTEIADMSKKIDHLATVVSGLTIYISEDAGEKRAIEKHKLSSASWTAIISSIVFAIAGIIITIILKT